jgi:hypothetical protein
MLSSRCIVHIRSINLLLIENTDAERGWMDHKRFWACNSSKAYSVYAKRRESPATMTTHRPPDDGQDLPERMGVAPNLRARLLFLRVGVPAEGKIVSMHFQGREKDKEDRGGMNQIGAKDFRCMFINTV